MTARSTGSTVVVTGILAGVPEGMYTRAQAARKIGRSVDTIIRWEAAGLCAPSAYKVFGALKVGLYSDQDLVTLTELARAQRPGRPRKVG